jgi:FkbM family methyltransferase
MNIKAIKALDKTSKKYRIAKWLYLNIIFYFYNIDSGHLPKFMPRVIGGQELDADLARGLINPQDGVVIDVGAERGEFSYFFYFFGFKVYAIEPEKKNLIYLWFRNWFRCLLGSFKIYRLACNEIPGIAQLFVSDISYRHSLQRSEFTGNKIQKVKQVRLGDFINSKNLNKIALLKIDAEGFDLPILKGLFNSTSVRPKSIMFETEIVNAKELVALVRQHGYKYFRVIARWPELQGVSSQKRICVYDGEDPEIYLSDNNNIICFQEDFRSVYPLNLKI